MNKLISLRSAPSFLIAAALMLSVASGCAPDQIVFQDQPATSTSVGAIPDSQTISAVAIDGASELGRRDLSAASAPAPVASADVVAGGPVATFDEEAFKRDVMALGARGAGIAALPAIEVANGDVAFRQVLGLVARSAGVGVDDVVVQVQSCGGEEEADCATRFGGLMSPDERLGNAFEPLARRMIPAVTRLRVVTWKPSRDGERLSDVVTIHGVWRGHLVGIVAFR